MGNELFTDLTWLPNPPADFRKQCRELVEAGDKDASALVALASFSLDENQLIALTNTIDRMRKAARSLAPLVPFRLAVLGNGTLDALIPALVGTAARHHIALDCVKADFGQTIQEALDPQSKINRAKPDAVLLAIDYRGLPLGTSVVDAASASTAIDASIAYVRSLREGFRKNSGAVTIVSSLAAPAESLFGSFDAVAKGTLRNAIDTFNAALVAELRNSEDLLLDVASLASTVGLADWHAPTQWNLGKFPFDARMLPLYAEHVCRIIGAIRGHSRKCLVLDLDNTLWGGVIGDDGLDGIVLGNGNGTGESFLDVQRLALNLRERGVLLAVSSKNNDDVARSVFKNHPDMLLKEEHIAVFQANWNDKATNITAIAKELNLGIDSMVFLDDNPVERGLVRGLLPQVAVPELPDNPALYARTLSAAGYFESVAFSQEDRKRAEYYQNDARRVNLQQAAGDVDAYLASLNMRIVFRPFDATGRSRISQLINKSNQFNLTTRRYSETDVQSLESDSDVFTLQVRLIDAFGDNGMISVIVCKSVDPESWEIDTWLMSCRVLGRRVEQMVLREIIRHAGARGVKRLIGVFRPTEKNAMVADHYPKLGFRSLSADGQVTRWELDTATVVAEAAMVVERHGFELTMT